MKIPDLSVRKAYRKLFFLWLGRAFLFYILFLGLFAAWLFGIKGYRIEKNIQKNYAEFLIKQNDVFVAHMIDFNQMTSSSSREYAFEEKTAIGNELTQQNEFLIYMQTHAPDSSNSDYIDIYQDMLQIYGFYIQGEAMIAEYCYDYQKPRIAEDVVNTGEQYTMGTELCNMFGNMILNNYRYINEVRSTNYESKFVIR